MFCSLWPTDAIYCHNTMALQSSLKQTKNPRHSRRKWIKKRKESQNEKRGVENLPLFAKSTYERSKMKTRRRNLKHHSKNSLKATEVAVEGLKKGEMVEWMNDKEESGGFVGFEWQKWRSCFGSGFFEVKQCMKKKERAKPALFIKLRTNAPWLYYLSSARSMVTMVLWI